MRTYYYATAGGPDSADNARSEYGAFARALKAGEPVARRRAQKYRISKTPQGVGVTCNESGYESSVHSPRYCGLFEVRTTWAPTFIRDDQESTFVTEVTPVRELPAHEVWGPNGTAVAEFLEQVYRLDYAAMLRIGKAVAPLAKQSEAQETWENEDRDFVSYGKGTYGEAYNEAEIACGVHIAPEDSDSKYAYPAMYAEDQIGEWLRRYASAVDFYRRGAEGGPQPNGREPSGLTADLFNSGEEIPNAIGGAILAQIARPELTSGHYDMLMRPWTASQQES